VNLFGFLDDIKSSCVSSGNEINRIPLLKAQANIRPRQTSGTAIQKSQHVFRQGRPEKTGATPCHGCFPPDSLRAWCMT